MQDQRKLTIGIVGGLVVALIAVVIGVTALDRDSSVDADTASPEQAAAGEAPPNPEAVALFTDTCSQCHTLTVADSSSDIGPNLDDDKYDRARVIEAIENGGSGSGGMAPNLLTGDDAQLVAELVAGDEPLR